ncbi:peptidoglycan DD-metalloendopeptidase family protein [Streptomyces sp. NPDC059008]|uniref:peptidoglycan DD-metalloendopeptidase family protein n=1 Tax=Streptomyces sp. NPDC059008 TaxID=3346693 RepID=UPI0036C21B2F
MNDRHPSEGPLPTGSASDASYAHYPAYDAYGQQHSGTGSAGYGDGDPLFGSLPGSYDAGAYDTGSYATGAYGTVAYDAGTHGNGSYDTGSHDTSAYGAGAYDTGSYDTGAYDTGAYPTATGGGYATGIYDTGSFSSTQWDTGAYETGTAPGYDPYAHTAYDTLAPGAAAYASAPHESGAYEAAAYDATSYGHGGYDTGGHATGAYDTGSYPTGTSTGTYETTGAYETAGGYDTIGRQATAVEETAAFEAATFDTSGFDTSGFETQSYEATAIWPVADQELIAGIPAQAGPPPGDTDQWETATWEAAERHETGSGVDGGIDDDGGARSDEAAAVADAMTQAMPVTPADPAPAGRRVTGPPAGKAVRGRGRRRPAKRSALLTVAVPSVAAMGVCGVAAASVAGIGGDDKDETTTQAAVDPGAVKPSAANKKLDTQLAGLSAGADDFRDRASRTQERIDLKERQALERKRKAEEAARKEAMRPKFVLPVSQHGLSALFGQAGVNWMSVHTGIDFPVDYGTPVLSATDGTVRTQWNSAYGNMAIVTSPDGTETWYCHLSSTKIRSGSIKAGDQIAYSGNSGNSTGPHLHFEVRPGGGSAIDPLPWLRSHGLDPN